MLYHFESTSTSAILCAMFAVIATVFHAFTRFQGRKHPPGPRGDPFIGNVRHMPKRFFWLYYTELKKQYGDLVYMTVMRQKILLIGSYDVAHDLLSKRGAVYSERYRTPLADETIGLHPPLSPYGPRWKEERRMYHSYLGKDAIRSHYWASIERQVQVYLLQSLEAKKSSSHEYIAALTKAFLRIMYGIKAGPNLQELIEVAAKGSELGHEAIVPGVYAANLVPGLPKLRGWLRRLIPELLGKDRHMEIWNGILEHLIVAPYELAKKEDKEGSAKQSFTIDMIHDDSTSLTDEQVMYTAGSTFVAGADTTLSTVQTFILAMLLHLDVQKKAQDELDSVVGRDRLPTIDDLNNLPFIEAIFKELLRWRPAVPVALPHATTKVDVYNGYIIPEGTMIVQNTWAISRDENIYPEPEKFLPERFLAANPPLDPRLYAFSVGRRICPGLQFGESVVMATMLTILSTMNIVKALDLNGKEIPVEPTTNGAHVPFPLPFEFKFEPRSDAAVTLLRDAVAAA